MSDSPLVTAPAIKSAPPLRVTIGLLLLWTTTTALTLGLASSLHRSRDAEIIFYRYPESLRQKLWLQDVLWFLASPAYGAALAASVVAAWRAARQTGGFPTQPGHWIAVLLGIVTLGGGAITIPNSDEPTRRMIVIAFTIVLAGVGCLASVTTRQPRRRRVAMFTTAGVLCGLAVVIVAGHAAQITARTTALWLFVVLPAPAIALAVFLAGVAATIDLVRPPRYDLFHWLGIITLAVLLAHPIAAMCLLQWY